MNIRTFQQVSATDFARITSALRPQFHGLPMGSCIEYFDAHGEMVAVHDQTYFDLELLLVAPSANRGMLNG